jgi:hypothetical protein
MDGTSYTGSCGTFAINATGALLSHGGVLGASSPATVLAQNQLPNIAPTVTVSSVSAGTPTGTVSIASTTSSMQAAGDHTHGILVDGANGGNNSWMKSGTSNNAHGTNTSTNGDHAHGMNAHNHSATFSGTALATHNHTATATSINGGVAPQPLTLSNFPRINVNYFICVN